MEKMESVGHSPRMKSISIALYCVS